MTNTQTLPDDAVLRKERRSKVRAAMEEEGIDILVLGREGNARYVSGAPRLWTAGSRAFGPGCVMVRATGDVHLLSTWDEGVPDEIPHENLYGISFNRENLPGSWSEDNDRIPLFDGEKQQKTPVQALHRPKYNVASS